MDDLPFAQDMADSSAVARRSPSERWGALRGRVQEREDRLPSTQAVSGWSRIYALFGATGESAQDDVFCAVNAYFAKNGCSPYGKYARNIVTTDGVSVCASDVVKITGRLEGEIRQFLRGRLKDSYDSLRISGYLTEDEDAKAMAEEKGIPRHLVHLLADWLKGCEYLTADESDIYVKVSKVNIASARERRAAPEVGGKRADIGPADVGFSSNPHTPYDDPARISY